jgi:hypothetical protein
MPRAGPGTKEKGCLWGPDSCAAEIVPDRSDRPFVAGDNDMRARVKRDTEIPWLDFISELV